MGRLDRALEFAHAFPDYFIYAVCDDAGVPMYVGCTSDPVERWTAHLTDKTHQQPLRKWIAKHPHRFEVLASAWHKDEALGIEREYIAALAPPFNNAHAPLA